jgi:hypothetical protein
MSKVLGGVSVDKRECLAALQLTDWTVHKVSWIDIPWDKLNVHLISVEDPKDFFSYSDPEIFFTRFENGFRFSDEYFYTTVVWIVALIAFICFSEPVKQNKSFL